MTTIVTRAGKGSPLTNNEMDQNLINLNDDKVETGPVTTSDLTMATNRLLGRTTASTGAIEEISIGGNLTLSAGVLDAVASAVPDATTSVKGIVELATDAEAQAGTDTTRAVTPSNLKAAQIQNSTAVTLTSQTAIDFTGLPSNIKRVAIMFVDVSLNNTGVITIQAGNGSFDATGYSADIVTLAGSVANGGNLTTAFYATATLTSGANISGKIVFEKVTGNTWVQSGILDNTVGPTIYIVSGRKSFSSALERLRITAGGTVQFDAGTINISFE